MDWFASRCLGISTFICTPVSLSVVRRFIGTFVEQPEIVERIHKAFISSYDINGDVGHSQPSSHKAQNITAAGDRSACAFRFE